MITEKMLIQNAPGHGTAAQPIDPPSTSSPAAGSEPRPYSLQVRLLLRTYLLKKLLGCLDRLDGCGVMLSGQEADSSDELYRTLQVKIRELAVLIRQLLDKP